MLDYVIAEARRNHVEALRKEQTTRRSAAESEIAI